MKKQLIGLILALTLPLTAIADTDTPVDSNKRVEHLTKELGLNPEQKTKVQAIFDAQRAKMKVIHDETHTSLQSVFTPEQWTKFEAMQEKRKQMHKERMQHKK